MNATLRAIHATAVGAIAIVKQLARKASELGALGSLEQERRHCSAVLTEVNHESLARTDNQLLTGLEFLGYYHLTVGVACSAGYALPQISFLRSQSNVVAHIYLSTVRRQNLAIEFGVLYRS